ncbi:MAG: tRNA (N6-isopentenyl adenosine(37)-C2)-methylthiotransferase MiaB, partial [Thermacetogeniaceae bacterium]
LLEEAGLVWTDEVSDADVVVLNTCSVRQSAEQKVLGFLGTLKHLKESRPGMIVAVGGCMTQNQEFFKQLTRSKHVNVIFGARSWHRLPSLISRFISTRTQVVETDLDDQPPQEALPAHRDSQVRAYVTIIYGCDNFCSYCVVPYARGREKSRQLPEILQEVQNLTDRGYREVTLLGQNVNSYGKDLPGQVNFAALLRSLDQVPGLARISYMTSHPRDFSDELIETIRQSQKVCEHFHLPLQSGSNSVLERMNRGYTREQYIQLVAKIRSAIPGASITTDLILGFPGETGEEFEETLALVRQLRFDSIYTFLYSPRPGTPAALMSEQVSREVKQQRFARLAETQNGISLEINQTLVGQSQEVLVEGKSKNNPERWSGRTRTAKIVVFAGDGDLTGEILDVAIDCAQTWNLIGDLKYVQKKEESLPITRT